MSKTYTIEFFNYANMRSLLTSLGVTWSESKGFFYKEFTVNADQSMIKKIDERWGDFLYEINAW